MSLQNDATAMLLANTSKAGFDPPVASEVHADKGMVESSKSHFRSPPPGQPTPDELFQRTPEFPGDSEKKSYSPYDKWLAEPTSENETLVKVKTSKNGNACKK